MEQLEYRILDEEKTILHFIILKQFQRMKSWFALLLTI